MHRKFIWLMTMIGIVAGVLFLSSYFFGIPTSPAQPAENSTSFFTRSTPVPETPYYDVTIPHLRSRNYTSKLTVLDEYEIKRSYTSHLASYDSDGLQINGLLTVPNEAKPAGGWPAIVLVHGYIPPALYKTTQNYNSYMDYFASRGFVVFKTDLRGHDESEGEPGGAYYSSHYVVDTLNAKAALQNADFIDRDNIGLWGHSMAGNVVFRSLVADQNIPAVVIWAGAVYTYDDFQKYRLNDSSYRPPMADSDRRRRRQELFDIHGEFDTNSVFWQQGVPTNYTDGVNGAIQLHHAGNDPVVNIGYSRDLTTVLDPSPIEYEFYEYQTGGHNITGTSFTTAMERSVEFFTNRLTVQ